MTTEHTPNPPEDKFKRWEDDILNERENVDVVLDCTWKDGFRAGAGAGADAKLAACVEWLTLKGNPRWALALQEAMRPKPPSLAEAALEVVTSLRAGKCVHRNGDRMNVLTAALERLQELENANG